jgi:uncharacterized HAD superfamily protein
MKDNRKKIGIDIDGVLSNFVKTFRNLNNELHGTSIVDDPTDWDFKNWNLSPDQLKQSWSKLSQYHNFWETLEKQNDVKNIHLELLDDMAKLYFITTRTSTLGDPVEKQTNRWIKNIFQIQCPTVIVTNEKGPVVAALDLDAFIDDNYTNLVSIDKYSPETQLYYRIFSYRVQPDIDVIEVNNFHDFVVDVLK